MNRYQAAYKRQKGFSFVEIIAVIVVIGIMSLGVLNFITDSASAYAVSSTRNQVSSAGRIVIERISMELHNALPNSIRTSTALTTTNSFGYDKDQCIEFIPVEAATTYIDPTFRPASANMDPFDVINLVPHQVGIADRYAAIFPANTNQLYKDSFGTTEAIVPVTIADADDGDADPDTGLGVDGINEITPANNHRFRRRSPSERLFITSQPVSFCVSGNKLFRYSDYGFSSSQMIPEGPMGACAATCLPATTPERVLITDQLDNSILSNDVFDFLATNRRRNGVVQMEFNFSQDGENVRLNHEVLQQATP